MEYYPVMRIEKDGRKKIAVVVMFATICKL